MNRYPSSRFYNPTPSIIVGAGLADIQRAKVSIAGGAALRGIALAPIEILPAPGAGKFFSYLEVAISYKFNTVAYDFTVGNQPAIMMLGAADVRFIITNQALNGGASFNAIICIDNSAADNVRNMLANTALVLGCSGGVATNATVGDGALDVFVYYKIEDVKA